MNPLRLTLRRGLLVSSVLLVAVTATCALVADEAKPRGGFELQSLPPEKQSDVLQRTRYLTHTNDGRPQLSADVLRRMHAVPEYVLQLDNATFYLSRPFSLDPTGRQIALAFVEVDGEIYARILYRSNSQFGWRLCDATTSSHIGKGFHEFDKEMPIPVSVALLKLGNQPATLRSASDDELASQPELATYLLRGLTEDGQLPVHFGRIVRISDGKYCTQEYAAQMAFEPMRFSHVDAWLETPSRVRVADVGKVTLPPENTLPSIEKPVDTFEFRSLAYAALNNGNGQLSGKVYLSRDEAVRYLFFEDSQNRAVLSVVESLRAQINVCGLRSRYLDVAGMVAPLIEYGVQIPERFGGRAGDGGYRLNWKFVREQPIIKYYYHQQGRAVPPDES